MSNSGQDQRAPSLPGHTRLGQVRDRVAARRGRNIGVVAAARELTGLVFYGQFGRREFSPMDSEMDGMYVWEQLQAPYPEGKDR